MPRAPQSRPDLPSGNRLGALAAVVRAAWADNLDRAIAQWDATCASFGSGGLLVAGAAGAGGPVGPLFAATVDIAAGPRSGPRPRPRPVPSPVPATAPELPVAGEVGATGATGDAAADSDEDTSEIDPAEYAAAVGHLPGDPAGDGEVATEHIETWRLVERAQGGDGDAFGMLYDRYVDIVYRFIYYRVNDRALAEDFTSETFLRALRRISTISYQGRDIGAWFMTIARNIVLDHVKSARNRLEVVTGDTIESDRHERSTESAVLESLTAERLMAAVAQLGDEQRECVMLRFIQGFSVSETAAVMGKNDGAIKALQHRAVRKLAEIVGGELR